MIEFILSATATGFVAWWIVILMGYSINIRMEKRNAIKLIKLNHALLLQNLLENKTTSSEQEKAFNEITPEEIKKEVFN